MGIVRLSAWAGMVLLLVGCGAEPVRDSETAVKKTYQITAVAGAGGSIFPQGDVAVAEGAERNFVVTPDADYQVHSLSVDGADQGKLTSYTFPDVRKSHTIAVQFVPAKAGKTAKKPPKGKTPPAARSRSVADEPEPGETEAVAEPVAPPVKREKPVRAAKPVAKPQPVAQAPAVEPAPIAAEVPAKTEPAVAEVEQAPVAVAQPPVTPPVAEVQPVAQPAASAEPAARVAAPPITPVGQLLKSGASAEEQGLAVVREADQRETGFGDFRADIIMVLTNPNGDEVSRYINYSTLEVANDGDKSLVLFNRPADIAGTALLTHGHKADADDQWLYLPTLKRVKRISSSNKSGSFVGSEFAYEDLSTQEVEKYQYKLLREESYGGKNCFVIDAYPVDAKSGYTRQERWIDKDDLLLRKVNYYDRKGELLKTLEISNYQKYLGRYSRAEEYMMKNHQNGKVTRLLWKNYNFRSGITAGQLTPNALEQAK